MLDPLAQVHSGPSQASRVLHAWALFSRMIKVVELTMLTIFAERSIVDGPD